MTDKTFKVNPGDEIIITVPRKQPSANEILMRRAAAPKAMIRPRRAVDSFPRRLKKDGLLNIYDLGYLKNLETGLFDDLGYFKLSSGFDLGSENPTVDFEDYDDLYQYFLAIPQEHWKDRFYRWDFENAKKYKIWFTFVNYEGGVPVSIDQIKFEPDEANWTAQGLKMIERYRNAQTVIVSYDIANTYAAPQSFYIMTLKDVSGIPANHITDVFDKDAPAVELNLSGKIDFYYVPMLLRSVGSSVRLTGTDLRLYLNDLYTTFPRDAILNESNPYYEIPIINNGYANSEGVSPDPHVDFKRAVDFLKILPGARAFDVTDGFLSADPISIDDFPGAFIDEAVLASGSAGFDAVENVPDNLGEYIPNSTLKAVIVRNDSQVFYVW